MVAGLLGRNVRDAGLTTPAPNASVEAFGLGTRVAFLGELCNRSMVIRQNHRKPRCMAVERRTE